MGMAKRVKKNHYIAQPRHNDSPTPVHVARSAAYSDGEDSQRAPSERTLSEYTSVPYHVVNERNNQRSKRHQQNGRVSDHQDDLAPSVLSRGSGYDNGSDIYVTSGAYRAPSEMSRGSRVRAPSHLSYRSGAAPSVASTRTSRKGGLMVETMAAPNPLCPSVRGMCCLMLLLNLAIVLITLGFVIVLQFYEPFYVWILGLVFLIFGFITLIGSLIYCVVIFREAKTPKEIHPEDIYWTHHWQKNIGSPEIHYKTEEKFADDRYSDRYSVGKVSGKHSNKNGRY